MDEKYISNSYRNSWTLSVYYGMRLLVFIAAAFSVYERNWTLAIPTILIGIMMMIPSLLHMRYRFYFPFALDFGIVTFTFLTLFLGHIRDFYNAVPNWDKFLHFQSGILFAVAGFVLVYILNENERVKLDLSPGFVAIFAIAFSITIGVFWEIGEFIGDSIFNGNWQASLDDTMWDLIADSVGALIVSIIGYVWIRYHKRLPFTPSFFRILKQKIKKIEEK